MTTNKFIGTGIAIITPFLDNGEVDFDSLKNLVNFQISNGVNYLVVLGTTGEAATLNKEEKNAVIDCVIETNNSRVPIVVGFGGNNTHEIVQQIENYQNFDKIDAILSVAPYYNKPSQEGLFQHYKLIAESSPVPVIIYNVPGRTSVNINAETTLRIARELQKVIAVKEASGNLEQIMQIIKDKPEDFLVISGDDAITYPMIQLGASGVISVIGNAFPKEFSCMVMQAIKGENKPALDTHYRLFELIKGIFTEGNPAGVKAILHQKGIISNHLRLPLIPVSESHYKKLNALREDFTVMA
ncbi:4-hydroxy-tetrahydrodipicolinate synthase [Marinifilum caeruleilacunae]|uniref:4-hydroxy-tetrahydrodipicolinate synthase n=1 Tax=Marinifilum caeruleilacunae TaxID=2499076 RepID=A0ABX1WRR3_9BACT|nr:4-hydroxy-tetrahydrodipicolinate synthase [Marinifilum caeruleilacunae]NOU58655.1 4-hydroxy-tetrahydrodipicolinate synthase [Marinifilum caeruleilacunae]